MKKLFLSLILILAASSLARAQVQPVQATLNSVSTGACTPTSCLVYTVPNGVGGASISLTGTSGTATFETVDVNGNYATLNVTPSNSSTAVTTSSPSGNSQYQVNVAGFYQIRVRLTSAGSIAAIITPSTASARAGGGGSGGSIGNCGLTDALTYYSSGSAITCDTGITTNTSGQLSATGGFVSVSDGVHPGPLALICNTTLPALASNSVTLLGCPAATNTAWSFQMATAIPTTNHLLSCVVTGTNCLLTDSGLSTSAPQVTVETSGTTATYTTPSGAAYLIVEAVGPGGGGGGSGTGGGVGSNGSAATTFSSLSAGAGSGAAGAGNGNQAPGGASSGGDINFTGGPGGAGLSGHTFEPGGIGGMSFFSGAGPGGAAGSGSGGTVGNTNSGSGGGGGGTGSTASPGGGGGAGGYVRKLITSPAGTYTYTVGTGGGGGTAGTSGGAGGAGAAGIIIVTAYFR